MTLHDHVFIIVGRGVKKKTSGKQRMLVLPERQSPQREFFEKNITFCSYIIMSMRKRDNRIISKSDTESPPRRKAAAAMKTNDPSMSSMNIVTSCDTDLDQKMPAVTKKKDSAIQEEEVEMIGRLKPPPPKMYQLGLIEVPVAQVSARLRADSNGSVEQWETWDEPASEAPEPVWETWADVDDGNKSDDCLSWSAPDDHPQMIEVYPGLSKPLRGAVESEDAFTRGYFASLTCLACTLEICCIKDAEYVVCPLCHNVTPLEFMGLRLPDAHGVGIGLAQATID